MTPEHRRYKAVYDTLCRIMYDKATRFSKKHGNWLVLYAPKNQVIVMDTWNGHIKQGHCTKPIVDDGYSADIHAHSGAFPRLRDSEIKERLEEAVDIYKTFLTIKA